MRTPGPSPSEIARRIADEIRVELTAARDCGFDDEQSLHVAAGYVAGRHGLGVARVGKIIDLFDRDIDRRFAELEAAIAERQGGR